MTGGGNRCEKTEKGTILTFSEAWQPVCAYGGLGLNGAGGFAPDYDILDRERTNNLELISRSWLAQVGRERITSPKDGSSLRNKVYH